MSRRAIAVGAAAAAAVVVVSAAAEAGHRHWFYDSYRYYEQDAYSGYWFPPLPPVRRYPPRYHTHRQLAPGEYYEYEIAPGRWVRVYPHGTQPPAERRRARQFPPETSQALRVPAPPLPKRKPDAALAEIAPEAAEGESARQPATAEPQIAVRSVPEPPARSEQKPASRAAGQISCEAAAGIVGGFGFSDVRATSCSGNVYSFSASRDGSAYSIKLSAADGELTEVKKH